MSAAALEALLPPAEDVDLSDLDLLDDTHRHASCDLCQELPKQGQPFTAWCGRRAIWLTDHGITGRYDLPPDPCVECATLPRCVPAGHLDPNLR